MRNIEQLAKSYDRDVAVVANSLTAGINQFIDVIAGNYSMKATISQLMDATDELSNKVFLKFLFSIREGDFSLCSDTETLNNIHVCMVFDLQM
jgi:hypothetical protein